MKLRHKQYGLKRGGLTLVELLVSVTILLVMIMAFSTILSQSQKVVSGTQATLRANSAANAIAEVIRNDLRKVSKQGFLCITEVSGQPTLLMTSAGASNSIVGNATGTGTVVSYGLCNNNSSTAVNDVFYRQCWVLDQDPATTGLDKWNNDLGNLQILPRFHATDFDIIELINTAVTGLLANAPASLTVPATDISEINELWQALSIECTTLEIVWTDGTINDAGTPADLSDDYVNWFGIGNVIGDAAIEEAASPYQALWTHHNQNNWPKAIKIRFTIRDDALPEEFQNMDYEVICPIGG